MTFGFDARLDDEAIQTDRYLDALLASSIRRGTAPDGESGAGSGVETAARTLRLGLLPVHPSFQFEERVGRRLESIARARWAALHAGAGRGQPRAAWTSAGAIGSGPAEIGRVPLADERPESSDIPPGVAEDSPGLPRPILIGGAITSAALSLAGAVAVAWWRGRPARSAMARIVRAAHDPIVQRRIGRAVASAASGDQGRTA